MTFAEIAWELTTAIGSEVRHAQVPHEAFVAGARISGAPKEDLWMLDYLFSTVLDGRNARLCDGIQHALGHPATDFADFAKKAATTGCW